MHNEETKRQDGVADDSSTQPEGTNVSQHSRKPDVVGSPLEIKGGDWSHPLNAGVPQKMKDSFNAAFDFLKKCPTDERGGIVIDLKEFESLLDSVTNKETGFKISF